MSANQVMEYSAERELLRRARVNADRAAEKLRTSPPEKNS